MAITASCGNCGKTYQAPDRLAGKSVRCKQCGEAFRVDSAEGAGELDLDALERSVSGEELPTHMGTAHGARASHGTVAGGPTVDAHGRSRIDRGTHVDAVALGGGAGANVLRTNYRYRYPGAKQVDQFLPWVLLVGTFLIVLRACLNAHTVSEPQAPSTAVGVSRFAVLLLAYAAIVWPAGHIALRMAIARLRVSTPRAAAWRSFAGFLPVLLLGGGLFTVGGGSATALVIGLLVGATLAVGTITLLFRFFPNEVPVAAGYVGGGALAGAAGAVAAVVAVNLVGTIVAGWDKDPQLLVSPIAVGLPWIDKPAPVVVRPKPPTNAPPAQSTAATAPPPTAVAGSAALQALAVPRPEGADVAPLVATLETVTAVAPGFDSVVTTPVLSNALGVVRNAAGGVIECWDTATWRTSTPQAGRGFDASRGALAIDPTGRLVVRLVRDPVDRIERLAFGNSPVVGLADVKPDASRTVFGFVSPTDLLMRVSIGSGVALERYRLPTTSEGRPSGGRLMGSPIPFVVGNKPLEVAAAARVAIRLLPDGKGYVIAGRDASNDGRASLALYGLEDPGPEGVRQVPWADERDFLPVGLAVTPKARAALLLDSAGAAYLTTWDLRDDPSSSGAHDAVLLDGKIGQLDALRPSEWNADADPLLWLDEQTLLVYGDLVVDALTGRRLGRLGVGNVTAQLRAGDGAVLLVQRAGGLNTLVRMTMDATALASARRR